MRAFATTVAVGCLVWALALWAWCCARETPAAAGQAHRNAPPPKVLTTGPQTTCWFLAATLGVARHGSEEYVWCADKWRRVWRYDVRQGKWKQAPNRIAGHAP